VIELVEHIEFDELRPFYKKLETRAADGLKRLKLRVSHTGATAETETIYGRRARSIIEFAVNRHVDLIVLGSHRVEPGDAATGLATVSYEVAVLAPCPVLLLK
jgi:nucleotide-binding universal stress UspA family protein